MVGRIGASIAKSEKVAIRNYTMAYVNNPNDGLH